MLTASLLGAEFRLNARRGECLRFYSIWLGNDVSAAGFEQRGLTGVGER